MSQASSRPTGGIGRGTRRPAATSQPPGSMANGHTSGFGTPADSSVAPGGFPQQNGFGGGGGFNRGPTGGGGGVNCHKCGQPGHIARDCPSDNNRSGGGGFNSGGGGNDRSGFGGGGGGFSADRGGNAGGFGGGRGGGFNSDRGGNAGGFGGGRDGGFSAGRGGNSGGFGSGGGQSNGSGGAGGFGSGGGGFANSAGAQSGGGGFSQSGGSGGFGGGAGGFGSGGGQSGGTGGFGGGASGFGSGGGGGRGCFNCNQEGHRADACPEPKKERSNKCYNCGQEGHRSNECSEPQKPRDNSCHNCGQEGHQSRDCTEPRKPRTDFSNVQCHNCQETGHMSSACTKPRPDGAKPPVTYIPDMTLTDTTALFNDHINTGINFAKYGNIPVHTTGNHCEDYPAAPTFEAMDLAPAVYENLKKAKYENPTPIQRAAIPVIIGGRDVMACAQTGSGKTGAYIMPTFSRMLKGEDLAVQPFTTQNPKMLIMSPTRELSTQIFRECVKFSTGTAIKPQNIYGGVATRYQAEEVKKGCNVIIATPGRLKDFLEKGVLTLKECRYLVLDEADRMLDQGFEGDIRHVVETYMPKDNRQTLMFSATFKDEVQQLAREFLNNYVMVTIGIIGGANEDIEQVVLQVEQRDKKDKLMELLSNEGYITDNPDKTSEGQFKKKCLVFVKQKRTADFVASFLSQSNCMATSIHSDREQKEREIALRDLKQGRCCVLIATSVAARGLDIAGIDLVINYDMPDEIEEYVHRIGRTARIGNSGRSIAFFDYSADEPLARELARIMTDAKQDLPEFLKQYTQGGAAGGTAFGDSRATLGGGTQAAQDNDWGDNSGAGGAGGFGAAANDPSWD